MFAALLAAVVVAGDSRRPLVSDRWRFPASAAEAKHKWEFAKSHCQWLEAYMPWDRGWIDDARWRCRCWDLLDNCRRLTNDDSDSEGCRIWLAELRLLIGREAFERGIMPDHVPEYRFRDRQPWEKP